jgi:hypothetical protein
VSGQHNSERFDYLHEFVVTIDKDLEDKFLSEAVSFQVCHMRRRIHACQFLSGAALFQVYGSEEQNRTMNLNQRNEPKTLNSKP